MSTDGDTEFRRRLRLIMQQFGSVADLAKAVGVSDNAIYKWVSGRGQPGMASLVSLAKAAGVSVEWLATGEGTSKATPEAAYSPDLSNFCATRSHLLLPTDGGGSVSSSQVVDVLLFQSDWFRRQFDANASDVVLFEVRGDSMAPTIGAGDLCLANLIEKRFSHDGLYALCSEAELVVRRLQREVDGSLMMLSDNPAYRPLKVQREDIVIVGRVIWVCGKP